MTTTATEYEIALETARAATRVFMAAQKAYRAGEIDDSEFLAAKTVYDASDVAFDAARGENC